MYHYFVSYVYAEPDGVYFTYANTEIILGKSLDSIEAVKELQGTIEEYEHIPAITILNFQLLKKSNAINDAYATVTIEGTEYKIAREQ